jgi:hypothetical protein
MATGAKPALEPLVDQSTSVADNHAEAQVASETKPISLRERIIRKLTEIFEHNERLGVTRQ